MIRPSAALFLLAACAPDLAIQAPTLGADTGPLGLILLPNWDDDDGDGAIDFGQGHVDDDDVIALTLTAPRGAAAREKVTLGLSGDVHDILVWHGDRVVLGGAVGTTWTLPEAEVQVRVESGEAMARATLTLARASGASVDLPLTTSPLILNHHLQPAEAVWVMSVMESGWNNDQLVADLADVFGSTLRILAARPYRSDVWVQDEPEFGTVMAPGRRGDVVLDSIRNRGLATFPDSLVRPSVGTVTYGEGRGTTWDSFGNLETSPPVTVDGVHYPFGRIYYGVTARSGPNEALRAFLDAQRVQAPFQIATDWLCVGHVDEFTSFVPDTTAPRGFRLLVSDPDAAWAILDTLDPASPLPRYARGHGYATVGAIVEDQGLRGYNASLARGAIASALDVFRDSLALTDDEIVRVPGLFERVAGCGAAALIPGAVNLLLAEVGGETHAVIADPFLRPGGAPLSDDPFAAAVRAVLPAEITPHFVDDWDVYHLGMGEVHCGTNTRRTPDALWWEDALHLLEAR